ncbi:MAG: hypothetical protein MRZ39_03465 [Oscillospiraceae bacterium]|nr:hypothetical protein [Oscillospiraceae bacterium]
MNNNDNKDKDIFDYDSYVKSNGKKKKKPRPQKSAKAPKAQKEPKSAKEPTASEKKKPEKKLDESIESIRKMFDDALDEQSEEFAELTMAEPEPEMPDLGKGGKRKGYLILGALMMILAVIGLISTVSFTVDKVKAFADNTQQKTEFARFIYPVVICDPAPFGQSVKLRSDTVITAAIWDIILYEDKSKYESDFDMIIVPELDVEQHAAKLFGTGLSIKHQSILGADVQFYYNEDIKSYRIPANPKYFTYSPYIEDITRVGESYTITVGYVSPTPAWLTLTGDETPEPEKYVNYIVQKRGDEYTLLGIQQSDKMPEDAGNY